MSVLSDAVRDQVEQYLVTDNVLTSDQLREYKEKAAQEKTPLFPLLLREKVLTNEQLTRAIAASTNSPYVNLETANINFDVLTLLPKDIAERYMAVPLGEMQHRLVVAMLDADNVQAVDFLSKKVGRPLKVFTASEEGIRRVLAQYERKLDRRAINDLVGGGGTDQQPTEALPGQPDTSIKTIVQDSPISKVLSATLEYAVKNRASDIHVEPLEKELQIRCRIDGVMHEVLRLPKDTEAPLVSRIKILSNLKIDEHRIPQDGQFTVMVGSKGVDLRIAISPVVWGEQVVIRLLDKSGTALNLESMGYAGRALRTIRRGIDRPNGMILTSGPTGSGKSTSLYALINEIKSESINIVTLEDPVEYKMDGVNQIQVHADVGLTFASGLRSILRQDPDVVMVGEIRDKETAQLAVQAALTGHLVFSTLHTNSAAGILPRLLDMGIEPFLIASTVHTVIGQRLVRRVPENAREQYQSTPAETAAIQQTLAGILPQKPEDVEARSKDLGYKSLPLANQNAYTLYKGIDTPDAPGGFSGRMGLYEVFEVTEEIQNLIIKQATSTEIQKVAQSQGMITMREDGYLKALAGLTTIAEVNRVAAIDNA
jgi:type IV pilus assembly protein PilB